MPVILSMNKDGSVKDTKSVALQEALVPAVFPFVGRGWFWCCCCICDCRARGFAL